MRGYKSIDEYMDAVQETALKAINHKVLKNEEIMFRAVEVPYLVPRYRIEMGFVVQGQPVLASTMREKDPRIVGKKLADYAHDVIVRVAGLGADTNAAGT